MLFFTLIVLVFAEPDVSRRKFQYTEFARADHGGPIGENDRYGFQDVFLYRISGFRFPREFLSYFG
jgi:hypothetical protein